MDKDEVCGGKNPSIGGHQNPNFSLTLHSGGKFHTRGDGKYIGGQELKIENVQRGVLAHNIVKSVLDITRTFRLYHYVHGGFILINDDAALSALYEEKVKGDGTLSLYVDEMYEEDRGNEDVCGNEADVDVDNNECGGEMNHVGMLMESSNVQQGHEYAEEEDIVQCDSDFDSGKDSDGEDRKKKFPMFHSSDVYEPNFHIGMNFDSRLLLRKAIHSHGVITQRNVIIKKNDKTRLHAKCDDLKCGWKLHALPVFGEEDKFQIRKYQSVHTCAPSYHVKNMRADWICGKYLDKFKSDPTRKIKGFREDAILETKCHITPDQAYRAKKKALTIIEGDSWEQYNILWEFIEEVKRSNPGSTVILSNDDCEDGVTKFGKLYMCLDALKKGFVSGCRKFLGVDGCHLSGPHEGVLLTAVGVDPQNNIFPLAIAVVFKEDRPAWEWFLTLLKMDLHITDDHAWTFMSDKQKGLISAVNEVFPNAAHRFCVRHLHENFKRAGYVGLIYKRALWRAAMACTINQYERRMEEMKVLDTKAHGWFNNKPPAQWSRSHFTDISKCDMLLNNGCESFNSCILEARQKPIVSMLEWILEFLMTRMQKKRDECEGLKWRGPFCPGIQELINKAIAKVGDCIPVKADKYHYQINCFDGSKYAVDLRKRTCGCRRWDLTGIPCKHAMCAIYSQKLPINDFVHSCYTVETYEKVYGHVIFPINGRSEWKPTCYVPPLPPNDGRGVGRPERCRRRGIDEPSQKTKKKTRGKPLSNSSLGRQQTTVQCGDCGAKGHNRKTCGQHGTTTPQGVEMTSDNDGLEEIVLSEVVLSGDEVNNEGGGSHRPAKLKARRQRDEVNNEGRGLHGPANSKARRQRDDIGSTSASVATSAGSKCLKTAPTPFEQLQDCQVQKELKDGKKKKFKQLSQI